MSTMSPEMRAVMQGRCLDLVDRAVEEVYEKILKPEERRHLAIEDLVSCEQVEPQFEYRLEVHYKLRQKFPELRLPQFFWFYSLKGLVNRELVMGALIGGDLMVVEASTREGADKLASDGLKQTLEIARGLADQVTLLPDVVEDPNESVEKIAAGRRAQGGAPMRGDMAEKINRMFGDKAHFGLRKTNRRLH